MQVRIDGGRASSDNRDRAWMAPTSELPKLGPEDVRTAEDLGMSAETYARSCYAVELSVPDLQDRAGKVGMYVQGWLKAHGIDATVDLVWLKTLEGKYRIDIDAEEKRCVIITDEDLIDDLFERGSSKAENEFGRVLMVNLLPFQAAHAS